MTKFAAYDHLAIYAIADSAEAAIAAARHEAKEPEAKFETAPIDEAFAAKIERDGFDGFADTFDVINGIIVEPVDRKSDLEQWFMQMRRECTPEYLNAEVNELLNSTESEVDEDGSVWICNPQTGHWASEDELAALKRMIGQNS